VISNYSEHDAAVKLKTSANRNTVRFVYVRAMSDVTVSGIAAGEYLLQFSTGVDWDESLGGFRRNRRLVQFERPLPFREDELDDSTRYSVHKVTLHPVRNGNARTEAISPEDFTND
jgi:hypothetical protein